jgi:amidase
MKSINELVSALQNKQISSLELVEQSISRIENLDKNINAVVVRDFDNARNKAKIADQAIAKGEKKPLLGIPITIKESFRVAGLPTTWGNPQYKDWIPDHNSLVVTRLQNAGAIIIGKTNVPFMLKDWQTYNSIYGTTNNPWNPALTSGGSSGGSAAALAAGFVALELGSDMAGSLRVPAHFCGVFAHKPTPHVIPMRGAAPPTLPPMPGYNDFAVAGPMARSAADLKVAFDLLIGPDELSDGKAYTLNLPRCPHDKLNQFRVLILNDHPLCPTATSTKKAIEDLADQLIKLGANVTWYNKKMPDLVETTLQFLFLMGAQVSTERPDHLFEELKNSVAGVSENNMEFSAVLSRGMISSHRDWLVHMKKRNQLCYEWRTLFNDFDVMLCPVMPTTAFAHDHSDYVSRTIAVDQIKMPYNHQFAWPSLATLLGLPVTVMPIKKENNLPIGIQIIGNYLEDNTTLQFAHLLENVSRGEPMCPP